MKNNRFPIPRLVVLILLAVILLTACQPPRISSPGQDISYPVSSRNEFCSDRTIDTAWAIFDQTNLVGMPAGDLLLSGDQIFTTTFNGFLTAVRLPGLNHKHSKKLADGLTCPPAVFDNTLYCGIEIGKHNLLAYDLVKGKTRWTYTGSPVVSVVYHSGLVISAHRDGRISAFTAGPGQKQWQTDLGQKISQPLLVLPDRIIAVSGNGRMRAFEPLQGRLLWEIDLKKSILTRLSVSGNDLYLAAYDGSLQRFDVQSGRILNTAHFPAAFHQPVSICGEAVYATTADSRLYRLDRQTLRTLWMSELKAPCTLPVYCFSDYLLTADAAANLLFIDPEQGRLVKSLPVDGRVRTGPVFHGNDLLFGMEYNRLIQFRKQTR